MQGIKLFELNNEGLLIFKANHFSLNDKLLKCWLARLKDIRLGLKSRLANTENVRIFVFMNVVTAKVN